MQTRRLIGTAMLAASCALPLAHEAKAQQQAPISPASEAMTDKARQLYDEGRELYVQRKWEAASAALLAAWSLKQHWQIAGMLGLCEMEMGKPLEAAGHLTQAVRMGAGSAETTELAKLQAALERAKAEVGAARVQVDEAGAELLVDGKVTGTAPFEDPVFLAPGTHVLQARKGTKVSSEVEVEVAAGRQVDVALRLEEGATEGAGGSTTVDIKSNSASTYPILLAVDGALVLTGATIGVVYGLKASGDADDVNELRDRLPSDACVSGNYGSECSSLQNARDDYDSNVKVRNIGLIVGGVGLVAAGVTGYLWWQDSKQTSGAVLVPAVGPGYAGVMAATAF